MTKAGADKQGWESPYAARPWLNHYDYWVREHMNYPRRPLHEILRVAASEVPDRPATAFLGAHLTFGQLKEQADRCATALARLGIKQGDRVGIMLPNCPQYIIATFAILRLGALVVNVNPLYTPREVLVVASDSGMCALLTLDALAPIALNVLGQTKIEHVIITSLAEYSIAAQPAPIIEGTRRLRDLLAGVDEPD
jgi:long-chain acyl-CoA synthetase